jgi:hypothetical protein
MNGVCGDESRRPYGTARVWGGRVPRVSPGAIFDGSLREWGRGGLGSCNPTLRECAKDSGAHGSLPDLDWATCLGR